MFNAILSISYGVSSRAVLFIINFIAVKYLLPEEYGAFSYILGIIASLATLSSFGAGIATNTTVARHMTSNPNFTKKVIFSSLTISSTLAIFLGIVLIPILDMQGKFSEIVTWKTNAAIIAIILLISLNGVSEGSLNGASEYKKLAINSLATFIISITFAWALTNQYGFDGAFTSIIIYRLILTTLNTYKVYSIGLLDLRLPFKVVTEKPIREVFISISLPSVLGALMVAPVIALAMRLVAGRPNGLEDLAYFSWVYQIYLIAVFIPSAMGGYFVSRFSKDQSSRHDFIKILKINILFSFIAVALLFLFKSHILSIAGPSYTTQADKIFNILIPTSILYSANSAFSSYWPSKNRAWFGFFINGIWASIIIGGTWINVDKMGSIALAISFLASYSVLIIVQLIAANQFEKIK